MAKKAKSSKDSDAIAEENPAETDQDQATQDRVEEIVEDAGAPEAEPEAEAKPGAKDGEAASVAEGDETDAEPSEDTPPSDDAALPEVEHVDIDEVTAADMAEVEDATPEPEADARPEVADLVPTRPEQVVIRKGGFFPTLLGGLIAAGIGFGVAWYGFLPVGQDETALVDLKSRVQSQAATIDDLTAKIDALSAGADQSDIKAVQSDQQDAIGILSDRLATLESQLSDLGSLEAGSDGSNPNYEIALRSLQASLDEQRAAIDAMTDNAATLEENAQAAAKATLQRAAMTRIQTALDAGTGFASALTDLEGTGVETPPALHQVASEGVPSMGELLDALPDAARAALAVSRKETGAAEDSGDFVSFLRNQLGARSLEPREGADPDAVLSRVEAAVRDGRLTDALAELEGLPEAGRAELSTWSGQVARRLDAIAAAQELSEKLN